MKLEFNSIYLIENRYTKTRYILFFNPGYSFRIEHPNAATYMRFHTIDSCPESSIYEEHDILKKINNRIIDIFEKEDTNTKDIKNNILNISWSDIDRKLKIVEEMRIYGGSFIKNLSKLIIRADENNFNKLVNTFSEYFKQYNEGDK